MPGPKSSRPAEAQPTPEPARLRSRAQEGAMGPQRALAAPFPRPRPLSELCSRRQFPGFAERQDVPGVQGRSGGVEKASRVWIKILKSEKTLASPCCVTSRETFDLSELYL